MLPFNSNANYGGKNQGTNSYVKSFNYGTNFNISEDLELFISREENPTNNGVAVWNSSTERFETDRGVLIDPSGNMELLNGRLIQRSREPYPLTIYVSKSGNDITGTGSETNPFLTIQRAINLSEEFPFSTNAENFPNIYVNAGFYDETLTIRKNIRIYGVNEFTSNNLGNFAGFYATRIGSVNNFVNIISDIPSGGNHIINFENLDFRCRISNVENGSPLNRILMVMNYCNINKPNDPNPILNISGIGTGTTQRSILYISNVRSNGTCSSNLLPAYELVNSDLYIEQCRWNGTASAVGMMRLTSTSTFINCEILQIGVGLGITNLPTIVCNFTTSSTVRFSNTILGMLYSAQKISGANLITIPSTAPFGNTQNPTIILDDCFMNIVNSTSSNYILQNNSGKNIRLQFHRVNNLTSSSTSGGIDYTNITVNETSSIITPVTHFLGSISGSLNNYKLDTLDRVYQELNTDPSWNAVNGYYGLSKDAYPALNPYSSGVKSVSTWNTRITNNNNWYNICWSPELGIFVAVATSGTTNRVMTSNNGINWTTRTTNTNNWQGVCWSPELGIFVAVSTTGSLNRVMTSNNGIIWTTQPTNNNNWRSVCWSAELGLFVAVAISGTSDRVMTSPDGITWTTRTTNDNVWQSVCWSAELGLFVAVSTTGSLDRVMTSNDGIVWTTRTTNNNEWRYVCWSPELGIFVAVSATGTLDRVMTSPDGINWTVRTTPVDNEFQSVCWSPELSLFVAVSRNGTNNKVITSPNGINWTTRTTNNNNYQGICWSPELGIFVATATSGALDRVMTSSLAGRPPTSYNVFDNSFNNIDSDGNWTLKAKNIYTEQNLSVQCENMDVRVNNGLSIIYSNANLIEFQITEDINNSSLRFIATNPSAIIESNNNLTIRTPQNIQVQCPNGYITHQSGKMARTEEIRVTIGRYIEPNANFFTTNNQNVNLYKVDTYFNPLTPKQDGWYCYLFNYDSAVDLTSDDGKTIIGKSLGPNVIYQIQKWSTQRITLVWVDSLGDYVWSVSD